MSYQVPASYLQRLFEFVEEEYGIPSASLLSQTEITLEHHLDAKSYVDEEIFRKVTALATQTIDDPTLGLKFGSSLHVASHGPLGAAIMSCSTVQDMFAVVNEFGDIRFPFRFKLLGLEESDYEKLQVLISYPEQYKKELALHCQICAAGTWTLISDLIGHAPTDFEIQFPFSAEEMPKEAKKYLPCEMKFNQGHFGFKASANLLELSLPGKDEVSNELFIALCRQIRQQIKTESAAADNKRLITQAIMQLLEAYENQFPTAPKVAEMLGMSGRTLRQKLSDEGTNYRTLLNQYKISRAKTLLASTSHSHDYIAEQLGYQDTANFSRAFKKETGQPPSEFRQNQKFSN